MSIRTTKRDEGLAEARALLLANAATEPVRPGAPAPPKGAVATWAGWQAKFGTWPWRNQRFVQAVAHEVQAPEGFELPLVQSGMPAGADARRLREYVGLTVDAVAEKLQVPGEMLTAYEGGEAVETRVPEQDINRRHHANPSVRREWVTTRFEPGECLRMADPLVSSRLYSAMALTRSVGATIPVSVPVKKPDALPCVVVGAELLDEVLNAAWAINLPPAGIPTSRLMIDIARGELLSPTLRAWPACGEVAAWVSVFPGLAHRGSLAWTSGIADRVAESPPEATLQLRDELGVGTAGLWRCLGTIAALVAAHPELAERVEAAKAAAGRKATEAANAHAEARRVAAADALAWATAEVNAAERG